jgi:hypothetical protein
MSQLDIATLTVLLQANSAQFETKMAQARATAQREARAITREMQQTSKESRQAMELLGDSIGIRLPRELRKVISETSLIGPAIATAFKASVIAAVATEIIGLVPKIEAAATELGGFGDAAKKVLADATEQNKKVIDDLKEIKKLRQDNELIGLSGSARETKRQEQISGDRPELQQKKAELLQAQVAAQAELNRLNKLASAGGIGPLAVEAQEVKVRLLGDELRNVDSALQKVDLSAQGAGESASVALGDEARQAAEKYQNVLKGITEDLRGITARANAQGADEVGKIQLQQAEVFRKVQEDIKKSAELNAHDRVRVEIDAQNAIIAAIEATNAELDRLGDNLQKEITTTLGGISKFPALAFPDPLSNVTSGHGVLDLNAERVREATSSTENLKNVTLGFLQAAQTEAERYASDMQLVNAAYDQGLISVEQLNQVTKRLNPNFQRMQELGGEAARTLVNGFENAVLAGGGVRDILAGILEDLAKIILEAALNPFEKALGGFFGNLFGGLFGGGVLQGADAIRAGAGRALGGPVSANTPYVVGEHGPELMVPGASGSVIPNGGLGGSTVIYQIDARGADAGVEQRVMRAIDQSRKQAVRESVVTMREQSLRTT